MDRARDDRLRQKLEVLQARLLEDPVETERRKEVLNLLRKHPEVLHAASLPQALSQVLSLACEEWIDTIERQGTATFVLPGVRVIDITISDTQPPCYHGVYRGRGRDGRGEAAEAPLEFQSRGDLLHFFLKASGLMSVG